MSDLQKLLAELSEIAPQICHKNVTLNDVSYTIDSYAFWFDVNTDDLVARYLKGEGWVTGNPAYDWLQGVLIRVIKSKGWGYKIQSPAGAIFPVAWVYFLPDGIFHSNPDGSGDSTEALLTALIQAIKGE